MRRTLLALVVLTGCRVGGGPAIALDYGGEPLGGLSGEIGGYLPAGMTPLPADVLAGVGVFLVGGLFETPYETHQPFELKAIDLRYRRSFAGPAHRRWFGAVAVMGGAVNFGGDGTGYGGHLQIGREILFERTSFDLSFRYGLLVEKTTIPAPRNERFHFFHLTASFGIPVRD